MRLEIRFSQPTSLMKALLCISNSNASSEKTFRMVGKIVTENRMSMKNSTLCAFLCCKINYTNPAHKYTPSRVLLRAAKSATYGLLQSATYGLLHGESDG